MDGINPTLAFAALLFGLSNNARDAANDPANAQLDSGFGCPAFVITGDPPSPAGEQIWANALWDSTATDVPAVIDPQRADSFSGAFELGKLSADPSPMALAFGSDPILRRTAPVANAELLEEAAGDFCNPKR